MSDCQTDWSFGLIGGEEDLERTGSERSERDEEKETDFREKENYSS